MAMTSRLARLFLRSARGEPQLRRIFACTVDLPQPQLNVGSSGTQPKIGSWGSHANAVIAGSIVAGGCAWAAWQDTIPVECSAAYAPIERNQPLAPRHRVVLTQWPALEDPELLAAAQALVENKPEYTRLDLQYRWMGDDNLAAVIAPLAKNNTLKQLFLSHNNLSAG